MFSGSTDDDDEDVAPGYVTSTPKDKEKVSSSQEDIEISHAKHVAFVLTPIQITMSTKLRPVSLL